MMALLSHFHFLRPWWLLALVPVFGLFFYNRRIRNKKNPLTSTFAPHLLPYLLVDDTSQRRLQPHLLLALFWCITVLALSGPSWRQEPSPFTEDQASLVIVMKVTPSMTAKDIQPSRLERSVHKIHDLLEMRQGAKTALMAYAGSAHQVMPLTRDSSIITSFAAELSPAVMPKEGDDVALALKMATTILTKAGTGGSILLITDSIGSELHPSLENLADNSQLFPVNILAVAAPPGAPIPADSQEAPSLDIKTLGQAASIIDGSLTTVTSDTADINEINSNIVRSHASIRVAGEDERWKDGGYLLLPLLTLLALFWCRRGFYVRWEGNG